MGKTTTTNKQKVTSRGFAFGSPKKYDVIRIWGEYIIQNTSQPFLFPFSLLIHDGPKKTKKTGNRGLEVCGHGFGSALFVAFYSYMFERHCWYFTPCALTLRSPKTNRSVEQF